MPSLPSFGSKRPATQPVITYAIAIHGGAGTIDPNKPEAEKEKYRYALSAALAIGRDELAKGGTALDACEKVVRFLEDNELFNAGKGAVFNEEGKHELDAAIMDGSTLKAGAVAAVRTVKNPVSLARLVMAQTPHILLIGDGAEKFADTTSVERVENSWFDTDFRRQQLEKKLEERRKSEGPIKYRGTVGCVALDLHGNLAAATSTGGLTAKRFGRVGDTPLIGAGTYADKIVAVSCTGTGEEFIRHNAAARVSALMEYKNLSLKDAADEVVHHVMTPDDGGLIAVSAKGEIATPFSTTGMYRGTADSTGKFEVRIFKEK